MKNKQKIYPCYLNSSVTSVIERGIADSKVMKLKLTFVLSSFSPFLPEFSGLNVGQLLQYLCIIAASESKILANNTTIDLFENPTKPLRPKLET